MSDRIRFTDPALGRALLDKIHQYAQKLSDIRIMEVCGTHTMEIGRLGLRPLLPRNIQLVSGPGCPVCVTPGAVIDAAIDYARRPGHVVASFGDMIRVPGTATTLDTIRTQGGRVVTVTSPLSVLEMAANDPASIYLFAAVGFETTIPVIARTVTLAAERAIPNIRLLVAHRTLPPALTALCTDPAIAISGFLLPGHVSAILGSDAYGTIDALQVPAAITGFDPLDILGGIESVLRMLVEQRVAVTNCYPRIVRPNGNPAARALIESVFEPIDADWRGIGVIPGSGLKLKPLFSQFDAPIPESAHTAMPEGCSCGAVLKGIVTPPQCPLFGTSCTPDLPVGPCMVSSEGSCAAYYRYERSAA